MVTVKKEQDLTQMKFVISQAVNHLSLNTRKKFVCLSVFNPQEKHTLEEWKTLMTKKKII